MNPVNLVQEIVPRLPAGRALDLACGAGRNAVWLAEQGWQVTAVDRAPGDFAGPGIVKVTADLEAHEFAIEPGAWDLIVMSYYLQRDLFEPVKRGLATGGVVIAIVHMFEPGHERSRFSVHPGELTGFFAGWEILHSYEGPSRDIGHRRAVAEIAAAKLSSL